jgi:hypothetical protein
MKITEADRKAAYRFTADALLVWRSHHESELTPAELAAVGHVLDAMLAAGAVPLSPVVEDLQPSPGHK